MDLTKFFESLANGARWDVGVSINRSNALPLDANSVFSSLEAAEAYVNGTAEGVLANAYPGQVLAVVTEEETIIYYVDANKALQPVGNTKNVMAYIGSIPEDSDAETIIEYINAKTTDIASDAALKELQGDVESLEGRADALESIVGKAAEGELEATGLVKAVADNTAAISAEVSAREQAISDEASARATAISTAVSTLEGKIATANENAISALQGRMDTAEADIDKLQEDLAQEVADRKAADEALSGRIDTLSGTVTENKNTYDAYVLANDARVKAVEDDIAALDDTYATDDELAGAVSTINGTITEKVAELKKYAEDEANAAEAAAKSYTDTEISDFNTETVAPIAARVKAIEDAPYTAKKYVDDQDAATLEAAKAYTDTEISDFNTETIAPLAERIGDLEDAVDAIDVGVTKVVAGNDIVVTPTEGTGVVTVAHETFVTGEYTKDPATSDKTGDQYFFTGVTVDNGHVTGANVKSLASVLEGMTFVFDGGSSTSNV